jgi:hypothetical protein
VSEREDERAEDRLEGDIRAIWARKWNVDILALAGALSNTGEGEKSRKTCS